MPKPLPKLLPVLPYPASKSPPCGFVTASNPAHKRPKFPFKTYHRRHSSSHWCLIPYTRARAHSRARSLSLSLCRQGSLSKHDECPKEKQHKPRIILLRNPSSPLPRLPRPPPPRRLLILGPITQSRQQGHPRPAMTFTQRLLLCTVTVLRLGWAQA